jgi:preprotein translocase subunit SecD
VTAGILALMPITGATSPRLGLDLQGGTSVTLKPRVTDGATGKITNKVLNQAVNVIRKRVDAIGVAEAEVKTEGKNIVISVPGKGRDDVLNIVGSTAELRFRQVLQSGSGIVVPVPTATAAPSASATPKPPVVKPSPTPTVKKRPLSQALLAEPMLPRATVTPKPTATATSTAVPTPTPSGSAAPATGLSAGTEAQLAANFAALDCSTEESRRLAPQPDIPSHQILACSDDGTTKYLLDKAAVLGKEIKSASAGTDQTSGEWIVDLNFTGKGRKGFGDVTTLAANAYNANNADPHSQVAIVLDGQVVSAPQIRNGAILGGQAQISGTFSQSEAENLANVLKFGALPLAFDRQQLVSVSATLGRDQLRAGLIAGAIGLVAVVLFSLIYYRGLGLVTIASLLMAGAITFGLVSLLGKAISFSLSLAGIAGVIVAIGITADSFIVYFERLRDEVREGRTLRSAAERGWQRAKRTILVADGVSLLAAVVLYILSIGSVRGFAFTLGLSTIIDVVLVFLFTYPMITLLVRTKAFGSGAPWTGMSADRLGARATAEPAGGGGRPARAHRSASKES